MTIHDAILSGFRNIPMIVFLALLTLQMYLVITAFRDGRSRKIRILYSVHFLASSMLLYLLLVILSCQANDPEGTKPLPPVPAVFGPSHDPVIHSVVSDHYPSSGIGIVSQKFK